MTAWNTLKVVEEIAFLAEIYSVTSVSKKFCQGLMISEGCPIHPARVDSSLVRFMYHYFTDLDFRWTMQGGLKMLSIRVDWIESTRIVSPVVDSSCRRSICSRRGSLRIESSRNVPHTNRLKFVATF